MEWIARQVAVISRLEIREGVREREIAGPPLIAVHVRRQMGAGGGDGKNGIRLGVEVGRPLADVIPGIAPEVDVIGLGRLGVKRVIARRRRRGLPTLLVGHGFDRLEEGGNEGLRVDGAVRCGRRGSVRGVADRGVSRQGGDRDPRRRLVNAERRGEDRLGDGSGDDVLGRGFRRVGHLFLVRDGADRRARSDFHGAFVKDSGSNRGRGAVGGVADGSARGLGGNFHGLRGVVKCGLRGKLGRITADTVGGGGDRGDREAGFVGDRSDGRVGVDDEGIRVGKPDAVRRRLSVGRVPDGGVRRRARDRDFLGLVVGAFGKAEGRSIHLRGRNLSASAAASGNDEAEEQSDDETSAMEHLPLPLRSVLDSATNLTTKCPRNKNEKPPLAGRLSDQWRIGRNRLVKTPRNDFPVAGNLSRNYERFGIVLFPAAGGGRSDIRRNLGFVGSLFVRPTCVVVGERSA